MIKVIATDLGGVLFSEGKEIALQRLAREYGYDKEIIYKVLTSSESYKLRQGLISDTSFWNIIRSKLPENYDTKLIKEVWYDSYILNEEIFYLLKKLKSQYKIVAFSGNIKSRIKYLDKKYQFRNIFDSEIYSYNCHFIKGSLEFVNYMLKKIDFKPNEIIYIDDNEVKASVAKKPGIHVIIYKNSINNLIKNLQSFGVTV
jgi:FMN phosphatase YigB (HAD superfamily)